MALFNFSLQIPEEEIKKKRVSENRLNCPIY